ncbi:MAG: tetratricopeptide repeat protein [Planctomycetaceae bacterium]|nr:tetratricopeptide repeat protein [Planctomycetaceae bacterium]
MRGLILATLTCLVATGIVPTGGGAAESASYSLTTIMDEPNRFVDRDVLFLCRFAATARLFDSESRAFTPARHGNFAAWPDRTILWEEEGRKNVLPTLYIKKSDRDIAATLARLQRYDLLAVTGRVVEVRSGFPCVLVSKIEIVADPSTALSAPVIDQMRRGVEALRIEAGDAAARHFEQALVLGLPGEYRAKAYEQLAQANLLAGRLDLARNCLQHAIRLTDDDPILHTALADVALRMHSPQEALAHASYAVEKAGPLAQAHGIRAEALAALGDHKDAAAALVAAAGSRDASVRELAMLDVRRARVSALAGNSAAAVNAYAVAADSNSPLAGDAWLHKEIGLFYEKLALESGEADHLEQAFAAYQSAVKLDQKDPEALYSLMEVEFRRQKLSEEPDYRALVAMAEKASATHPGYAPARILEGRVLFAQGRTEEAESRYQSVVNRVAHDCSALLSLAEAFVELGKPDEAAATVARARSVQPWNDRVQAVGTSLEKGTPLAVSLTHWSPAAEPASYSPSGVGDAQTAAISGNVPKGAPEKGQLYVVTPERDGWEYVDPNEVVPAPRLGKPSAPQPGRAVAPVKSSIRRQDIASARTASGLGIGSSMLPAAPDSYPQAIQASAGPASVAPGESLPVTRVRLPADAYHPGTMQENDDFIPADADPELLEVEAQVGEDGYLRFGMTTSSTSAYASMPILPDEGEGVTEGEEVRIPRAFSFKPDPSPVLLAHVRSSGGERDMPVRNANLYRRWAGGRRPAEIIEREPVSPRPGMDTPAVAPPGDGGTHRTEVRLPQVRLPSSSRGIGAMGENRHGR